MSFDINKLKTMPKRFPGTTLGICQGICSALTLIILTIAWLVDFSLSVSVMTTAFFISQLFGIFLWVWWQKVISLDVEK